MDRATSSYILETVASAAAGIQDSITVLQENERRLFHMIRYHMDREEDPATEYRELHASRKDVGILNLAPTLEELAIECPISSPFSLPAELPLDSPLHKLINRPRDFYSATRLTPHEFLILYSELELPLHSARNSNGNTSSYKSFVRVHTKLHPIEQLLHWLWYADGNSPEVSKQGWVSLALSNLLRTIDHVTRCIISTYKEETMWPSAEERKELHETFTLHLLSVVLDFSVLLLFSS